MYFAYSQYFFYFATVFFTVMYPIMPELHPITGSQHVHSAELPEDIPYLLLEDLHHNQTQLNTHSVKHTLTDPHSPAEIHVEMSATHTELETDPQLEMRSDVLIVAETHSVAHTDTQTGTHTAILVQLQEVSAVQAANTER